jgi:putative MATE family efflux protein
MLVVLAGTGVLRGLKDTRTPLVVAAAGAGANVALNLLLVHEVGLGIAGSAIGTAATQLAMAAGLLVPVARAARRHDVSLRPHLAGLREAWAAGLPLIARTLTLRAVLLLTTYVAAGLGSVALAAHQAALTVWFLLALALDAVAIAGQAITGHALGAADVDLTRASTARAVRWGVGCGAGLGALLLLGAAPLATAFSPDTAVQRSVAAALVVAGLAAPLAGYVFVLDGVLIGAGDGRYLAAVGLAQLVGFLPAAWAIHALAPRGTAGLVWLWIALAGGYSLARAVSLGLRVRGSGWLVTGADR